MFGSPFVVSLLIFGVGVIVECLLAWFSVHIVSRGDEVMVCYRYHAVHYFLVALVVIGVAIYAYFYGGRPLIDPELVGKTQRIIRTAGALLMVFSIFSVAEFLLMLFPCLIEYHKSERIAKNLREDGYTVIDAREEYGGN